MHFKIVTLYVLLLGQVMGQPPRGGGSSITCPSDGKGYQGETAYMGNGPSAAPLRGTIGCVGTDTLDPIDSSKLLIYGPFEAGFTNAQLTQFFGCSSATATIPGGLDTLTAERMAAYDCGLDESAVSVLDTCGGHANPYHYHERMTCLYSPDPVTLHSTRIGTALDGHGIYGKYIDGGVQPTDLDACGGRHGVTPDSNGQVVYYYVMQDVAPFTVGCFGPVNSVEECRALYSTCGDGDEMTITTASGSFQYDPDCPCFDKNNGMSNVPLPEAETTAQETSTSSLSTSTSSLSTSAIQEETTTSPFLDTTVSTSGHTNPESSLNTSAPSSTEALTREPAFSGDTTTSMPGEESQSSTTRLRSSRGTTLRFSTIDTSEFPIERNTATGIPYQLPLIVAILHVVLASM